AATCRNSPSWFRLLTCARAQTENTATVMFITRKTVSGNDLSESGNLFKEWPTISRKMTNSNDRSGNDVRGAPRP
ncbi:MAG: hypothetical protein JSW59_05080, partial [Phycisphaerales bacterium]